MRREHYFAPDTVTQLPAPRKPSRLRMWLCVAVAGLMVWYLVWFWQAAFDWATRLLGGWL